MAYDYSDLIEKSRCWTEQACASGWINAEIARQLLDVDVRSPETLFNHNDSRPLIVAFMGGTGVGKSTLLNRLAGKAIARTGVERPTSREVTLYHHHSVAMLHLPDNQSGNNQANKLPVAQVKIAQHEDDSKKNIVWIDMPDFDSTELTNKQQVLQWLPHIDVLIYVVSPERYRDEKAWRLLLAEGSRHAWLFVLNQWDRGQPEQYDDFRQQLHKAGFFEPIIFKTVCADDLQTDEFAALEATISSLATEHIVAQLELRGLQIRKHELKQKLQDAIQKLGSEHAFQQTQKLWREQWQRTVNLLQQGLTLPIQLTANYYAEHAADLIYHPHTASTSLWDAWAQARFDDALDELIMNTDQLDIPVAPLKNQLAVIREKAPVIMQTQTELTTRQALANPGNVLQRVFLKSMRVCEITLPLAAMAWVSYKVFMGYYTSNMANPHYLGVDFAVHSSLLIAISWLTPYFILKKSQPSLKKSALRGLNKGLTNALGMIDNDVASVIAVISHQHSEQVKQLSNIIDQCSDNTDQQCPLNGNSTLTRMLVE